jgi:outer membrane receptor protein involved in Fe transport
MPLLLLLLQLCLAVILCNVPSPTHADAIDEIVVTADFRNRAASDMPASVTVFNADQIKQRAVQHFEELVNAIPNLNWSGDGHRARYFQIRGAGELEQYQGAPNPSVGFLIDDIDFSGIGSVATLFDMQQVEVLRGPQGTRYGANALAGLIYMQSTQPEAEWSGTAQLVLGDDATVAAGLAFGGALDAGETVLLRMSMQRHQSDGFRSNTFLGRQDTNARDESMLRARLRWFTGNNWQVDLAMMLADIYNGYDAFALDNSYTVLSDKPGRDAQRSNGASVKALYSGWEAVAVTSITSLADSDIHFSYDADWGNADSWAPVTYDYVSSSSRQRQTVTQEIRFAGSQWLAGVYAMRLQEDLDAFDRGDYYDPFYDYADSLDFSFASGYEAINLAAFGQYEFRLGEFTDVSAGLRLERRSTQYADSADLREDPDETMVGGELSLRHAHSASVTSYLTLSRGYKAGGFNLGIVPDDRREFGAESMWNLEAGIKSAWYVNKLLANASIFYARRDEQQVRTSFQIDPGDPSSFVFFTDNAAEGDTRGLEAELRWQPGDAWDWYASIGLLDATFKRFVTPQVNLNGRQQAHAPTYSMSLGGRYSHPSGFFVGVDVTARDKFYFDVSHDEMSTAYQLANARLGFDSDHWSLQLWARNLFDRDYAVRGFFFGNEPPDFVPTLYTRLGDPRQVGASVDVRF